MTVVKEPQPCYVIICGDMNGLVVNLVNTDNQMRRAQRFMRRYGAFAETRAFNTEKKLHEYLSQPLIQHIGYRIRDHRKLAQITVLIQEEED